MKSYLLASLTVTSLAVCGVAAMSRAAQPSMEPVVLHRSQQVASLKMNEHLQQSLWVGHSEPSIRVLRSPEIGAQVAVNSFSNAEWTFYEDGRFLVMPASSPQEPAQRLYIVGTYQQLPDGSIELQGENLADAWRISLDGRLQQDGDSLQLEAFYSFSSINSQQIFQISQTLSDRDSSSTRASQESYSKIIESFTSNAPAVQRVDDSRLKTVQGIIPGKYNVLLTGSTGERSFQDVPAQIFIESGLGLSTEEAEQLGLQVDLLPETFFEAKESEISNVSLLTASGQTLGNFNFSLDSSQENSSSSHIMRKTGNGEVSITLQSEQLNQFISWTAVPESDSESPATSALASEAQLELKFEGNSVTGEIKANGLYNQPHESVYNAPSTYSAKITGGRERSELVDDLREVLSRSSFSGRWKTTAGTFGEISLEQTGELVEGTYSAFGGGRIRGKLRGNRLDFTWQDQQRGEGRGFLRAIAGGATLAGKINRATQEQVVMANWEPPLELQNRELSDIDIDALQDLSSDLALIGRCQQGIGMLQQVGDLQRTSRHTKLRNGEELQSSELIDELKTINLIPLCSFQTGQSESLLSALDHSLELQDLFSPSKVASRVFRSFTQETLQAIEFQQDSIETIRKTISDFQKSISFVGTGVQLGVDESGRVIIAGTIANSPAVEVGLLPQDILLEIDDESIIGLTTEQVVDRIRGPEGAPISFSVQRGEEKLDFNLSRVAIEFGPQHLEPERFYGYINTLNSTLDISQTSIKQTWKDRHNLEENIASGSIDPREALNQFANVLQDRRESHEQVATTLDSQILSFLSTNGTEEILPIAQKQLEVLNVRDCSRALDLDMRSISERDAILKQLIQENSSLSDAEKYLLERQIQVLGLLSRVSFSFDCSRQQLTSETTQTQLQQASSSISERSGQFITNLETWRKRLESDYGRIEAQEQGQSFFRSLTRYLLQQEQEESALVAAEHSKARAFSDLLLRNLNETQQVSKTQSQSSTNQSESFAFQPDRTIQESLDAIKRVAREQNSTIVQYLIEDEQTLNIWVVQPTGEVNFEEVKTLALGSSINQLVSSTRNALNARGRAGVIPVQGDGLTPAERQQLQQENLRKLHQLLVEPIASLLPKDENARVVFVPQGELFLVPFPALLDAKHQPLLTRHTIVTAPSIQTLELTAKAAKVLPQDDGSALVVGDPSMPAIATTLRATPQALSQLPGARDEAIAIAKQLQTKPIIGDEARKDRIVEQMQEASIIHLATHGLLDSFKGDAPGAIALAPTGSGDRNDGLLTASEIFNLKLQAELVVLSACDTGRGDITGDGVVGLSRSLFVAGAPSVLVSLWKVPDESTAYLMTHFYQYWKEEGLDKAQALRKAMLKTRDKYPHPLDWAAFTLIGQAE